MAYLYKLVFKKMNNKNAFKRIIVLMLTIFFVGTFLIGLVSVDEFVETMSSKEQFYVTSYSYVLTFFEQLDGYAPNLDDETSQTLLNQFILVIDEINDATDYSNVKVTILDIYHGLSATNDDSNDEFMQTLPLSLASGSRKIIGTYDYYNAEFFNYRLLLRIDCGGILQVVKENGLFTKLAINGLLFIVLTVILLLIFKKIQSSKGHKIAGIVFIIIWIGQLAITSSLGLIHHQEQIVEDEKAHVTSLTCFYYKEDIIEHNDEIPDRREFAESRIDRFTRYNDNIESCILNENYDTEDLDLSDCLDFVINNNTQKNVRIEFILSALLFIILAIIAYDKIYERIEIPEDFYDVGLTVLDNKIITIELVNIIGNCLTWSLMLPRLLELAKINGGSWSSRVGIIYSMGVAISTISSLISSKIAKYLGSIKKYIMLCFFVNFAGIVLFATVHNMIIGILAYYLVCIVDGLAGLIVYFYISGTDNRDRRDSFLVKIRSNFSVGQSIGIIVGGVLGSVLKYSIVLLIAAGFMLVSIIMLLRTNTEDYNQVSNNVENKLTIRDAFNKKESLLFLVLIIVPIAFYDVYLDYKFPMDIINLGLTTAVISFVSMIGRLVSAYTSKLTYTRLKKNIGLSTMSYVYLIGCAMMMLLYQLNASLGMIIFATIGMGLLDSFGTTAYNERFVDISREEHIEETDSNIIAKMGDKAGLATGPLLITLINNVLILPIVMMASLAAYMVLHKKKVSN